MECRTLIGREYDFLIFPENQMFSKKYNNVLFFITSKSNLILQIFAFGQMVYLQDGVEREFVVFWKM